MMLNVALPTVFVTFKTAISPVYGALLNLPEGLRFTVRQLL